MDYEKKYNEALERAKYVLHTAETAGCAMHKDLLTEIFPELRESEEERIRKALVWHLKAGEDFVSNGVTKAECIAYLEKQKEQVTDESDKIAAAYQLGRSDERKQQEPKPTATLNGEPIHTENQSVDIPLAEWSEEDENRLNAVVELLENTSAIHPNYSRRKLIIWLKSLRPSWKPREEQMNALNFAITYMFSTKANPTVLRDLYNDLLKLKDQ